MTRWRTRHRRLPGDRGAAAVEFAIVLVLLLILVFAIIDFGRLFFVSQSVKSASREGARVGIIATSTYQDIYDAAAATGDSATALGAGGDLEVLANAVTMTDLNGTLQIQPSGTLATAVRACVNDQLEVRVTVPFTWLTPLGALVPGGDPTLEGDRNVTSNTVMRCE